MPELRTFEKKVHSYSSVKKEIKNKRIEGLAEGLCRLLGFDINKNKARYETPPVRLGGKNNDKVFYIIRSGKSAAGTFSTWLDVAFYVSYALAHDYIPYVYMRGKFNPMSGYEGYDYCDEDRWGRSFKQPQKKYDIKEICESSNVIFSSLNVLEINNNWSGLNKIWFSSLRNYYHKIYNVLGPIEELVSITDGIDIQKGTFGMSVRREFEGRGTLSNIRVRKGFSDHQCGIIDDYIRFGYSLLDSGDYSKIFVACDDREGLERFKNEFGDKCCYYNRRLRHFFEKGNPIPLDAKEFNTEFSDLSGRRQRSLCVEWDYISETILLSRCDALLNVPGSQTIAARIMAENDIPVIDKDFVWIM